MLADVAPSRAGCRVPARQAVATVAAMNQRTLARTGVHVSPLCLGAMMFGAWGETDHDECARIIHRALDAGWTNPALAPQARRR